MASAATRCGVSSNHNLLFQIQPNQNHAFPCSLTVQNHARGKIGKKKVSAALMMALEVNRSTRPVTRSESVDLESGWNRSGSTEPVVYEKLDEWMRESVVEIVKNLREAPLLVHVYDNEVEEAEARNDGVESRMVMEKAAAEEGWAAAKGKWETGEAPLPQGLIFVEELGAAESKRHEEAQNDNVKDVAAESKRHEEEPNDDVKDGVTRAWGVVIQGKGSECPPACYLLKTSTAGSGSGCGLGLGCTHFCLVRVNSFRETADSQLRNCWLLQAQAQAKAQAQGL